MKRIAALLSIFFAAGCTRANPLVGSTDGGCLCNAPPSSFCIDGSTLRSFASAGHCAVSECNYDHWDVLCQDGCSGGACIGSDPCDGIQCVTPPPAACADSATLVSYSPSGTCAQGTCRYQEVRTNCANGCASGACQGDPCAGLICDQPPASFCVDATTLRSFSSAGCAGGSCSYTPSDTFCAGGCQAGACVNDPCAGVLCLQPPAPSCLSTTTLQSYGSPGTCAAGICGYLPRSTTCQANATCTGGSCVCNFTKCSTTCCDAGQVCSKTSACCTPSCGGKACGAADGCGGKCQTGSCPDTKTCQSGMCTCTPSCGGAACGADDGCGGVCLGACTGMCSPACSGNSGCATGTCFTDAAYLSDCVSTGCHALPCKAGYREIPRCYVSGVGESTPLCLRNEITELWTRPSSAPCPSGTHTAWMADSFSTDCSSGPAPGGGFIYFEKLCLRDH
jgi:hypothetical protein